MKAKHSTAIADVLLLAQRRLAADGWYPVPHPRRWRLFDAVWTQPPSPARWEARRLLQRATGADLAKWDAMPLRDEAQALRAITSALKAAGVRQRRPQHAPERTDSLPLRLIFPSSWKYMELTVGQVAGYLGLQPREVRELAHGPDLDALRHTRTGPIYFRPDDVNAFLAKRAAA